MSSQIEAKKKLMKVKKPTYKSIQISQNNKKNNKIFDHPPKNDNNINTNINSTILNHNNNAKTIQKLQDELNIYKVKSEKLEEEIMKLNLKIKEMTEKNEKIAKKNEEEKNSEEDSSFSSQKKNPLKKAISSAYDILIELVELILNQKTYKVNQVFIMMKKENLYYLNKSNKF